MASLDNITGWQAEHKGLLNSDLYKEVFSDKNMNDRSLKIPLPVLVKYVELILNDSELRDAALRYYEFLQIEDRSGIDDPRYPYRSQQLLSDFAVWYALKAKIGANVTGYIHHGMMLAGSVASGRFTHAGSDEALACLKKISGFDNYIKF